MKRLILILSLLATPAFSQSVPLKEVEHVREGLITAGMALKIDEECSSVTVRMLRGLAFLNGLRSHAEGLGYTDAQIEAHLDDKAEEMRLRAIANDRLAAKGAVVGDAASYCAVGEAEMAAGSQLGRLLR